MAEPDTTIPAEGDLLGDALKDEAPDPAPGEAGPGARAEPDHLPHPNDGGRAA